MDPFRVAVVDDSALFRTIMRNVLAELPGCELVASVADGITAIDKIAVLQPDLVTLDLEMPGIDGLGVLREFKRRGIKSKVIMLSRHTSAGAQVTTDALIEGAFDFIMKPSGTNPAENKASLRAALAEKISALRESRTEVPVRLESVRPSSQLGVRASRIEAVVIGCSTGGPDALARIIPELPPDLPVPVFAVQHMPEGFTASLAARLNEASEVEVFEAAHGQKIHPGQVVIARGGRHLQLDRKVAQGVQISLTDAPPEHRCRPAVDYTLRSAVEVFDGSLLAVILTGMGRDGTLGCELVRARGGTVIAQDPAGCTVYGMPKSVIHAGVANHIVKLPQIAQKIGRLLLSHGEQ